MSTLATLAWTQDGAGYRAPAGADMVARADMLALLDTVASLQAAVAVLRERASRWPMVPHIAPPAPEPVA